LFITHLKTCYIRSSTHCFLSQFAVCLVFKHIWTFFENIHKTSQEVFGGVLVIFRNLWQSSVISRRVQVIGGGVPKCLGDICWFSERLGWSLEVLGKHLVTFSYLPNVSAELRPPSKCLGLPSVVMSVFVLTSDIFIVICNLHVSNLHSCFKFPLVIICQVY